MFGLDVREYVISIINIIDVLLFLCWDWCFCFLIFVVDMMKDMLDFFLFKDFNFFMICIGNIFVMIGFYVLFLYVVDYVL